MGKVKSAIIITLMTLVIAVMCFFCTVSFSMKDGLEQFNSVVRMTQKDSTLGVQIGEQSYLGGGYSSVYYPEGVISSREYEENYGRFASEDERTEYAEKYSKVGALYFERETLCDKDGNPTEEFKTDFEATAAMIKARYEALNVDGTRVDIADGYTIRVMMPQLLAGGNSLFTMMSYTGGVSVAYGSDADSATTVLPENKKGSVIGDYIKGFSTRTSADGTSYVSISFTKAGREIIKNTTADADSSSTMFFKIGDDVAINMSVSSEIDQSTLYVGGSYTRQTASVTAVLLDSALGGNENDVAFTVGDTYRETASFGDNALLYIYIAYGVCFVGMAVFFFARYKKLAFAHIYTYLLFFFSMLFCIWAINFLYLGAATVLGVMLASLVLCVSNALVYEKARKEYAAGRTITAAVKSAYKSTFWHIFDLHIVIAAFAFIVFGIALPALSTFAFTLGLGTAFSFVCNVAIGRLNWATMMSFTPRKGAFCNFKREETEDE